MLDIKKLTNVAKELGLDIETNSKTPGILFEKTNTLVSYSDIKEALNKSTNRV